MRPLSQFGLLFTYVQTKEQPVGTAQRAVNLPVWGPNSESQNGGISGNVTVIGNISVWLYPQENKRVNTDRGWIAKPCYQFETYRTQVPLNVGLTYMYFPTLKGGYNPGIYKIQPWSSVERQTTGGQNKIHAYAEFVDSNSLLIEIDDLNNEFKKRQRVGRR